MEFKDIVYNQESGVAKIIVNRPEVRNVLNKSVRLEIRSAIECIEKDKSIKVAIITGAGDKAFCAGADLKVFKEATPIEIEEYTFSLGQQLYNDVENLRVPAIAMVNGYCFGGGLELAMACDIRIASENARLGQTEINVGLMPGGGGTQRLPRLVGLGKAKELMYTGRIIDATEAERIGLVDKVVSQDKLEETVMELANTIASKSPIMISLIKKTVNRGMYSDLAAALDYEKTNFSLCFATEDHNEGIAAFLEKRKAEFKGK